MSILDRRESLDDEGGSPSNRTLLDIIQNDESGTAYKDLVPHSNYNKKSHRKSFKDRLGLRRSSSAVSHPIPTSDITPKCRRSYTTTTNPFHSPPSPHADSPHPLRSSLADSPESMSPQADAPHPLRSFLSANPHSMRMTSFRVGASQRFTIDDQHQHNVDNDDDTDSKGEEDEEGGNVVEQRAAPVMSLMDLLEETDRQSGRGSTLFGSLEVEDEEEEEEQREDEGGVEYVCCVCMVRHKGAAFIPCGHTFCRLCSRELWVSRGNCPLCNGFILEILDIF